MFTRKQIFGLVAAGFLLLGIILTLVIVFERKDSAVGPSRISDNSSQGQSLVEDNSIDHWDGTIPATASGGVRAESGSNKFMVQAGDEIEVKATGSIRVGYAMPWVGPAGQVGYKDVSVDSPYSDHVGGLEMWIGPDRYNNRYLIGNYFRQKIAHTGTVTFRVIDILNQYDNNSGAFEVSVKRLNQRSSASDALNLQKNDDGSYKLQASDDSWHRIGSGRFRLEVTGKIDFGGIICGPEGVWRTGPGIEVALAPNLPLGALIAKVGEKGEPFVVGSSHEFDTKGEIAYIAVNDTYYKDNSGSYTIYKKQ